MRHILVGGKPFDHQQTFLQALGNAIRGVATGIIQERSMRLELLVFITVCLLGAIFKLSREHWWLILFVSAFVFITELLNSSIETLADVVHPDYEERIQQTKDLSAGAVLLASIVAIGAGIVIFTPHIAEAVAWYYRTKYTL